MLERANNKTFSESYFETLLVARFHKYITDNYMLICENRREALQMTDGIENIGSIRWPLLGCLALGWIIVFLCLIKGIKSSGRVSELIFRNINTVMFHSSTTFTRCFHTVFSHTVFKIKFFLPPFDTMAKINHRNN